MCVFSYILKRDEVSPTLYAGHSKNPVSHEGDLTIFRNISLSVHAFPLRRRLMIVYVDILFTCTFGSIYWRAALWRGI